MNLDVNVCMSGGAEGSDLAFGEEAAKRKDSVIHYSFEGHRHDAPENTVIVLSAEELKASDKKVKKAAKGLGKKVPFAPYVKNLIRRNAYQVEMARSVYAVSTIKNNIVQGGTGWACQMFIDSLTIFDPSRLYVFDQDQKQWYVWDQHMKFIKIDKPPTPTGIYAGIGTRKLNADGRKAIADLYKD